MIIFDDFYYSEYQGIILLGIDNNNDDHIQVCLTNEMLNGLDKLININKLKETE
jgi:hypothetical protein